MWFWLLLIPLALWAYAYFQLRACDTSAYDSPQGEGFSTGEQLNDEHRAVHALVEKMEAVTQAPRKQQMALMREHMDTMLGERDLPSSITPVDVDGVPAEWVQAPGVDTARRLLYLHGGAFMFGSPRSHRTITNKLSEIANAAVLVIDYRLMPEHSRMDSVEDCRTAYRWILDNGPEGKQPLSALAVAGDSAGGNLTLTTIAWARDQGLRAADVAVALSPVTDVTMGCPSFRDNMESDVWLRDALGPLAKLPRWLNFWVYWVMYRKNPVDPVISPMFGDLSGLPPVLVQVSDVEMLRDDGRRYANKAAAAGSPVTLQRWNHVVHVWQMFVPELTEARQAFDEIDKFLQQHMPVASET